MTGVSQLSVEVGPKLLELLHEAVPSARAMALLLNPTNPNAAYWSSAQRASIGHIAAFAVAGLAESLTKSCKKFCPISMRRSAA